MPPRWERVAEPPPETGAPVMDALLTPHRSLTARAFLLVICVFSAMNVAVATIWALHGAWPVLFFLALDVALLTVAFHMNFRDGRMFERVRIGDGRLSVTRSPARGRPVHWVVGAHWARVVEETDAVRIAAGDRAVRVAAFLSPPERDAFAAALRRALERARP